MISVATNEPFVANAHRKPNQPVSLPALARHLAFRKDDADLDENKWIERIERLILTLFVNLEVRQGRVHTPPASISNLRRAEAPADRRHSDPNQVSVAVPIELIRRSYILNLNQVSQTDAIIPDGNKYETVVINATFSDLPILVRFEVFEEFFTLSLFLEFQSVIGFPIGNSEKSEAFRQLINGLNVREPSEGLCFDQKDEKASRAQITLEKLWSEFDSVLYASMSNDDVTKTTGFSIVPYKGNEAAIPAGFEVFADFRGFLLGLDKFGTILSGSQRQRFPDRVQTFEHFNKGDDKTLEFVAKVFPLILPDRSVAPSSKFEAVEFTWSTFENNTCLYGSALNRPQTLPHGGSLTYVLLFDHSDWRSVGRLVGRLHTMGTVRVAALLDFDRIVIRDQILSSIDLELNRIAPSENELTVAMQIHLAFGRLDERLTRFVQFCSAITSKVGEDLNVKLEGTHTSILESLRTRREELDSFKRNFEPKLRVKDRDPLGWRKRWQYGPARKCLLRLKGNLKDIQKLCEVALGSDTNPKRLWSSERATWRNLRSEAKQIEREIRNITETTSSEQFRARNLGDILHALQSMTDHLKFGLAYRHARSRYHRHLFNALAEAMQVKAIRGFQRYDEFVLHRLYRAYSMIESVKAKHEATWARALDVQKRVRERTTEKHMWRLLTIQDFGEIVLVFVIAPHYLYETLWEYVYRQGKDIDLLKITLQDPEKGIPDAHTIVLMHGHPLIYIFCGIIVVLWLITRGHRPIMRLIRWVVKLFSSAYYMALRLSASA